MIQDTFIVAYGPAGVAVRTIGGGDIASFVPGATSVTWTGAGSQFAAAVGSEVYRLFISPVNRSADVFASVRSVGGAVSSVVCGTVDGISSVVVVQSAGTAGFSRFTLLNASDMTFLSTFEVTFGLQEGETVLGSLSLMDADHDGRTDIAAPTSKGRIVLAAMNGVLLDNSPAMTSRSRLWNSAEVLAADLGGNSAPELIAMDNEGVMSIVPTSTSVDFQVGNPARTYGALGPIQAAPGFGTALFVTDEEGGISAFDLKAVWNGPAAMWRMHRGNAAGTSFSNYVTVAPTPVASGFLPADRVYNWPNPVYGSETRFRFFTDRDGSVTISIFDISGDRVTELHGTAVGGRDNELVWDVSGIQSGVYLARVEVTGGGQAASAVVKVAVVK